MNITGQLSLLTSSQIELLRKRSTDNFRLGQYHSLDEILANLKVDVIIEPGIPVRQIPQSLKDAEKYWSNEVERLGKLSHDENCEEDYMKAIHNRNSIKEEISAWSLMCLRGLYDPANNVIKLFPEEMHQEYNNTCMDELLVSTLAHETMHAYFNRPRHDKFPYVITVEEPLAEFGMLLYLHDTRSSYYQWAYEDVSSKRTCYKFGARLMDQYLVEKKPSLTRKYLTSYKVKLDWYAMPTITKNGGIIMPQKGGNSTPVMIDGDLINPIWTDCFDYPPRFFFDSATGTLGLDGRWENYSLEGFLYERFGSPYNTNFQNVYIGAHFYERHCYFFYNFFNGVPIYFSPYHKTYKSINGIPFKKNENTPALEKLGDDLYLLWRNRKCGIIDAKLNQIIPFKYDWISERDRNGLFMVGLDKKYGVINIQDQVQVPIIYEHIGGKSDGSYQVRENGHEILVDKSGHPID